MGLLKRAQQPCVCDMTFNTGRKGCRVGRVQLRNAGRAGSSGVWSNSRRTLDMTGPQNGWSPSYLSPQQEPRSTLHRPPGAAVRTRSGVRAHSSNLSSHKLRNKGFRCIYTCCFCISFPVLQHRLLTSAPLLLQRKKRPK